MHLRKTREGDIAAVLAILDQARVRLGALGIDQWQNGYPNRAAIEEDVARGRSYVVVEDSTYAPATSEACDVRDACVAGDAHDARDVHDAGKTYDAHDAFTALASTSNADAEGVIIATAMIGTSGEPTYDVIYDGAWLTDSSSVYPRYVTVHRVAVADGATGRGVARFLLGEAVRIAQVCGAQSVRIDTHEGNTPMRGLLRSCGFAECGVIMLDDPLEPTPERLAFEKLV